MGFPGHFQWIRSWFSQFKWLVGGDIYEIVRDIHHDIYNFWYVCQFEWFSHVQAHEDRQKKRDPQMVPGFFDTWPSNGGATTLGDYTDGPSDWLFELSKIAAINEHRCGFTQHLYIVFRVQNREMSVWAMVRIWIYCISYDSRWSVPGDGLPGNGASNQRPPVPG